MGDYESLKKIDGVPRPSLYREYARSIAHGLADYFASRRGSDDKK